MARRHVILVQSMNLINMLSELRSELQHIEEAILVVQRLAAGGAKRRGRPPKWMAETELPGAAPGAVLKRKRKPISAGTRKKMAAAAEEVGGGHERSLISPLALEQVHQAPLRGQLRTFYGFSRRGFSKWRGRKLPGDQRNPCSNSTPKR